jgi:hypothetical protein
MVKLDLCCAVLMSGLAVLAAYHGPALAAVAISAVNSLFVMPYKPAVAALTPQLVSEDELAAANALYSTVSKLAMSAHCRRTNWPAASVPSLASSSSPFLPGCS